MLILGFNAYHGDVSAALLSNGALVAALEEERFRRIKHVAGVPARAMAECLRLAGASAKDVDVFAVARGRNAHFWRRVSYGLTHRPGLSLFTQYMQSRGRQASLPEALGEALGIDAAMVARKLRYVEHHPAHLASAFFASGMTDAACCAIDGFGDFVSMSMAEGQGTRLNVLDRVYFPHSLGILYLAVTQLLGFTSWGDEYKVMGLAPYGQPRFVEMLRQAIRLNEAGRFSLDLSLFRHAAGDLPMTWTDGEPKIGAVYSDRLVDLLGPVRAPSEALESRHMDLAASVQRVFEEAQLHILNGLHARVPSTPVVPGRWVCDEQRGQWKDQGRHAVPRRVHSTGGRRQWHSAWRGTARVASRAGPPAWVRDAARVLGNRIRCGTDRHRDR